MDQPPDLKALEKARERRRRSRERAERKRKVQGRLKWYHPPHFFIPSHFMWPNSVLPLTPSCFQSPPPSLVYIITIIITTKVSPLLYRTKMTLSESINKKYRTVMSSSLCPPPLWSSSSGLHWVKELDSFVDPVILNSKRNLNKQRLKSHWSKAPDRILRPV